MNSKQKSNLQFRISHPNYNKNYYEQHKEIIREQQLKYYNEQGKYLKKLNYELNKEQIIKKNLENYYKRKNEKLEKSIEIKHNVQKIIVDKIIVNL